MDYKQGNASEKEFSALEDLPFTLALDDDGTKDWRQEWVVDGERADIRNTENGMVFAAGPVAMDHGCHAVLWTKKSFTGNTKVEFDFTRLDTVNRFVNILYFHAQGIGGEYSEDIHAWRDKRSVPYMNTYFECMNLLHVSYAAFGNDDDSPENYIRVRKYPVTRERTFVETEVEPTIDNTGFFGPNQTHNICFVKTKENLALRIRCGEMCLHQIWDTSTVNAPEVGPIGIRHMFTKCSRYKNIKIYEQAAGRRGQ